MTRILRFMDRYAEEAMILLLSFLLAFAVVRGGAGAGPQQEAPRASETRLDSGGLWPPPDTARERHRGCHEVSRD